MALSASDRQWFLNEIVRLDPTGELVDVVNGGAQLRYSDKIRSDETRLRKAETEELVRAVIVGLLCSPIYGYEPERMYIERTYSIGRPSATTAQVDLILYFEEEDGSETAFAMWEMKAPDEYKPATDPLIEKQLFDTAPLVAPSLLVYASVRPQNSSVECVTVDYTAHKSYASWDSAGRPST